MTARRYAIAAALVAWFGVLLQCYLSVEKSWEAGRSLGDGVVNFLGYFTVTTNLLVSVALLFQVTAKGSGTGDFFRRRSILAGIAVSIVFVALSYHVLLRHIWHPQGADLLANVLLHYVVPALFVVYWVAYLRAGTLRWTDPLWWCLYPTAYFVYALIRGEMIGRYPYGFIDVSLIGYQRTLLNAVGLLLVFVVLGILFVGLDRLARRPVV